jgi:hypothetical protein
MHSGPLLPHLHAEGTNKLTPNGPSASERVVAVIWRSSSTVRYPAATKPKPPALMTPAANAGVDGPPAMGAWMMGNSLS